MEGQTATNPQTGEKIVFRGGQWQPLNATGGPIVGPAAPVDPFKVSAEQRAQEDQRFQREKFEVERQKTALDMEKTRRDLVPGADTTEGEKTAGFLATRVAGGIEELKGIYSRNKSAASPSVGTEVTRGLFGDTAANFSNDADRQQVEAAQLDILDAALTLGTGAAYTAEQLQGYRRSYFPQLGDAPKTVAAKQKRLITMLEAAKVKAGRAAPQIDAALAAVQGLDTTEEAELVEFETNPNLVVGTDGRIYDKRTGQPVETPDPNDPNSLGQAFYAGVGDVAEGAGDFLGLVGNPLNAGINAIAGTNLSTDLGQTFRQATGAPEGDPLASAINRGGVSALSGAGLAGAARPIATGVGRTVTNALAQEPIRQGIAGATAGASSELARQAGANPLLQAAAGIAGGVGGFAGAGGVQNALMPRQASQAAQAFQRQGVNMLPADAGGTATKILTSGAKASPLSAGPIRSAARTAVAQTEAAVNRQTSNLGGPLTTDKAGEAVRKAAQDYTAKSTARGNRLYKSAYKAAGGVRAIKPLKTIAAIDEQIARLRQNPDPGAQSTVKDLQAFKKNLEGGVAIQGLRDARTNLSQGVYDGKLRSGTDKGMWKKILGNIAGDIDAGLRSAGRPQAAELFKRADKFWSERVEQIDEVLQPIIGANKGGEQILESVEAMARGKAGGNARLSRLLAEMPDEYANNVRATIVDRIGKATAGQQNAAGDAFSPGTFLTNWNKLTPQGKASLFADTKLRRNLDDIAMIADNMKATESFSNFSNTAMAVAGGGQSAGAILIATLMHPVLAGGVAGTQYVTGRMLASPKFANWLAKVPANPQALPAYTKRLDAIAAAEPIIANDIASVKQFLANAPSSSRAAASQGQDVGEERPIPPQ